MLKYEIKDLFLQLLYPTITVIMTVVQLKLFHENYIVLMRFAVANNETYDSNFDCIGM